MSEHVGRSFWVAGAACCPRVPGAIGDQYASAQLDRVSMTLREQTDEITRLIDDNREQAGNVASQNADVESPHFWYSRVLALEDNRGPCLAIESEYAFRRGPNRLTLRRRQDDRGH